MLSLRLPRQHAVALIAAVALAAAAAPLVLADPAPGGPSPEARLSAHAANPVVLSVPFGIDRGACDRGMLAQEIETAASEGRGSRLIGNSPAPGLIGGGIGGTMDPTDQTCVGQVLEYGPVTRPVTWSNPARGADYTVTPRRTYQTQDGAYCREYEATADIGNSRHEAQARACRRPDGSWHAAN